MAEREVQSPVSVKGSKVSSGAPLSPARNPVLPVAQVQQPIASRLSPRTAAHPVIPKNLLVRWR